MSSNSFYSLSVPRNSSSFSFFGDIKEVEVSSFSQFIGETKKLTNVKISFSSFDKEYSLTSVCPLRAEDIDSFFKKSRKIFSFENDKRDIPLRVYVVIAQSEGDGPTKIFGRLAVFA